MKNNLPDWLIICVWRALFGEIYPSIRAIALLWSENDTLLIRYYLDKEPSEFDNESIEVLATNISASIGTDKLKRIDIQCEHSSLPLGKLDCLTGFIYCRREYDLS